MTIHDKISDTDTEFFTTYVDTISLVERLHRLLLDVVKDEFERLGILDINPVQGVLLFNIAANEVTAGELRQRGYYLGSNVTYNLKKLVDAGYMHHKKCKVDRRAVRVSLTDRGIKVRQIIQDLFDRHAHDLQERNLIRREGIFEIASALKRLERFWGEQIRYIY